MSWSFRFHALDAEHCAARALRGGRLAVSRTLVAGDAALVYRDALEHELDHGTDGAEALFLVTAGVLEHATPERQGNPPRQWAVTAPEGAVSLDRDQVLAVRDAGGRMLWRQALPDSAEPDEAFFRHLEALRLLRLHMRTVLT